MSLLCFDQRLGDSEFDVREILPVWVDKMEMNISENHKFSDRFSRWEHCFRFGPNCLF